MIIIPIGIDCGIATFLKEYNLRTMSLPFDWIMTYKGVFNIIKNKFHDFLPKPSTLTRSTKDFITPEGIRFVHDEFPQNTEKYERRINRFHTLLSSPPYQITFFRKGHLIHNHTESNIVNEVDDIIKLDQYLSLEYPNLEYKIILTLSCHQCNTPTDTFTHSNKITIYNLSNSSLSIQQYDEKFKETFLKIFNISIKPIY
jgi:hypothetical protein